MTIALLVFLVLCSIHFWGWMPLWYYKNYTDFVALGIILVAFYNQLYATGLRFKKPIILFLIGIILNILSAYFNNGQGIKDTTLSFGYYYFIFLYFWLHEYKPDRKVVETMVIVLAIIYVLLNQLQISIYPSRLFHGTLFADRGTVRMRMEGASFMMMAYFMMLNRYLIKKNIFSILLAMLFLIIIILGGTRTFAAAAILLSAVIFMRLLKYSVVNYLLIVVAALMLLGILQLESTSRVMEGMMNTTQDQMAQGDRYIRIMQFDYFTKEYPQNWSYYIFGGGLPGGYGSYSNRMGYLTGHLGFFWVDQGLLGFYLVIGLCATLGMLWWVFKSTFIKLPPDAFYLNMYFAFLFLASTIVMDEIFAPGIFGVQAIGLYLVDRSRDELDTVANGIPDQQQVLLSGVG